jgi:NADPH:quinone reductase-like Zn-dependent oxidoreductase
MRAIAITEFGGADRLRPTDVDDPLVGPDSVLIRVRAAGINPVDYKVRQGNLAGRIPHLFPLIPGWDATGVVEQVGPAVTEFAPGDEVYAYCRKDFVRDGTYAELVAVRDYAVAPKPSGLSFEEAGGVPLAGLTALQIVRDEMGVGPGDRVLVQAAAGGVGSFAVQIAKAFGAEVTGVCSTNSVDLVRSIGADHVIDYTQQDFTRTGRRYDLILEMAGNRSLADLRRALTPKGTLVLVGGSGGRWFMGTGRTLRAVLVSPFVGQRLRPFFSKPKRADLVVLKELIEAGKLTPVIDRTFPLSETAEAIRYVGEKSTQGKTVITV